MANLTFDDLIPAGPQQPGGALSFDDLIPAGRQPSAVADAAKQAGVGVAEGGMNLVGLPGDLGSAATYGVGWLLDQSIGRALNSVRGNGNTPTTGMREAASYANSVNPTTSATIRGAVEGVTGKLPEPETVAGGFARTIGRNVPTAAIGPGGLAAKGAMAVVPGVAEEAAGIATRGSSLEPFARAAAGITAGVGTGIAMMPSYATRRAGRAAAELQPDDYTAAGELIRQAQARGVNLTIPEAMQTVTEGRARALATMQRHVENRPGGAEVMNDFLSRRGGQVEGAVRSQLDEIAPPVTDAFAITGRARRAADGAIDGTRRAINEETAPLYRAAEAVRVNPEAFAVLNRDPSFSAALKAIRSTPELNAQIRHLPDDSVGVLDMVKQALAGEAQRLRSPTSDTPFGNLLAARKGDAAGGARMTGEAASPEYGQALVRQTELRNTVLGPVADGPLGQMANASSARGVVSALFPENPLPGTVGPTGMAAAALRGMDPEAAAGVARLGLEDAFNAVASGGGRNASEARQFMGADFAKRFRGPNGEAAMATVANATTPTIEQRTRELMRILGATGERQPAGSLTEYNRLASEAEKRGGLLGLLTNIGKAPAAARDAVQQRRLESGAADLARLITGGSEAIPSLRQMGEGVRNADRDLLMRLLMSFNGVTPKVSQLSTNPQQ